MKIRYQMAAFFLIWASLLNAQFSRSPELMTPREIPQYIRPLILVECANFASKDSSLSRLDCYIRFANDPLSFAREGDKYTVDVEVNVVVHDDKNVEVAQKNWTETMTEIDFEKTNSKEANHFYQTSFDLKPGEYEVSFEVNEAGGKEPYIKKQKVNLKSFTKTLLLISDPIFVYPSTGPGNLDPTVTSNFIDFTSNCNVYFEIYNNSSADSVTVLTQLISSKNDTAFQKKISGKTTPPIGRTKVLTLTVPVESEKLTDGAFILLINAKCGKNRQQITKKFDVRWFEKPKSLSDFDRMVDYMKYVWTSEELKNFKNVKTGERHKIFNNYWHTKDPTPATPFNELMAEYFNRVDYANTTYKELGKDGWETDRGKVHILYGPPDRADLRHFNPGAAPFEIWFYNGIGRRFTFIDNEKIGIFKLSSVD